MSTDAVEAFDHPRELVAGIRDDVPAADIAAFFQRAIPESAARIPQGLITGPVVAVYRSPGPRFDVTVGFPVSADPGVADLEVVELPAGAALRVVHRGAYEGLRDAYAALEGALAERGAALTTTWERYVSGPNDGPDPAAWVTEVVASVVAPVSAG